MAGWEQLGEVLGGGIDRAGAFEQGRLRSAQTESALGLARQRQLENIAKDVQNRANDRFAESAAIAGVPQHLIDSTMGGLGNDFASSMQGGLRQQEMGFRDTLGDELAPMDQRLAAQSGVKGEVANPLDMMGSDSYVDLRNLPESGAEASLYSTPTGQATIAEKLEVKIGSVPVTCVKLEPSTVSLGKGAGEVVPVSVGDKPLLTLNFVDPSDRIVILFPNEDGVIKNITLNNEVF